MLRASRRFAPDEHMLETLPYCGLPPVPGELLHRFNLDPVLLAVLALVAGAHIWSAGCHKSNPDVVSDLGRTGDTTPGGSVAHRLRGS